MFTPISSSHYAPKWGVTQRVFMLNDRLAFDVHQRAVSVTINVRDEISCVPVNGKVPHAWWFVSHLEHRSHLDQYGPSLVENVLIDVTLGSCGDLSPQRRNLWVGCNLVQHS